MREKIFFILLLLFFVEGDVKMRSFSGGISKDGLCITGIFSNTKIEIHRLLFPNTTLRIGVCGIIRRGVRYATANT